MADADLHLNLKSIKQSKFRVANPSLSLYLTKVHYDAPLNESLPCILTRTFVREDGSGLEWSKH